MPASVMVFSGGGPPIGIVLRCEVAHRGRGAGREEGGRGEGEGGVAFGWSHDDDCVTAENGFDDSCLHTHCRADDPRE